MSIARKIAHNTAIQVGGKLIGTVLSLIAAGLVLRHLGVFGTGQYVTILAFLQIFGTLTDFGLYIVLLKKMTNVKAGESSPMVNTIFTLRIISAVIFLGAAPIIAWIISQYNDAYGGEVLLGIALTTLFYFFISMNQLLSAVFQKFLRTDWIALGEFTGKTVLLVTTITVVASGWGLIPIMLTLVASSGVNFFTQLLASRKYLRLKLYLNKAMVKEVFREAWPIALSIGMVLLYFKGDTVLLTFYEGEEIVGWYGAPYKILEVLVTFPAMFAGLALPVISQAWQNKNKERFRNTLQKSFDLLTMVSIPLIVGTWMTAPFIIQIIAGAEFANSVPILNILIIATAAIFMGTLFGYLVVAVDKQKSMIWGYGFVAISSFVAYLIFIPLYSTTGAAWVTAYSEIAVMIIAMWITLRATKTRLNYSVVWKSALGSGVMVLGVMLFTVILSAISYQLTGDELFGWRFDSFTTFAIVQLAFIIPIAILSYIGALFLFRAVNLRQLKEILLLPKS